MSRLKDVTVSIRTSTEIKQLLHMAAERERRSAASMIEVLVLEYARTHELRTNQQTGAVEIEPASKTATAIKEKPVAPTKRGGHQLGGKVS